MKDKVENVAILSMSDKEIGDALKIVSANCLLVYLLILMPVYLLACFIMRQQSKPLLNVIMLEGFCLSIRLSHAGVC